MVPIGKGLNFPPENPTFIEKTISYLIISGVIVPTTICFMNILNRTRIIGKSNILRLKPPYILVSNHLTLLDDLFLDPLIFFPQFLKGYNYLPYHAPEEHNFYRKALISKFMKTVKSIPVIRGKGIHQEGVNRLINAVKNGGILHIYPEGTRSRIGEIGKGKGGFGRIVYESGAPVVPMYHQGLERVLPIGTGFPKIGKEIRIAIGKSISFDEERLQENSVATWKSITTRIMDALWEQKTIADQTWGEKPIKMPTLKKQL